MTGQGWALAFDSTQAATNTPLFSGRQGIATFGLDAQGEVYMSNVFDGKIYRFAPTATAVEKPAETVRAFRLEQNYPNPFNPTTRIRYHVQRPTHVTITVFDLLGRDVATLVDVFQAPGRYDVTFDAEGLPGGVYLYQMQAGDFVQAQSLLLLK